MFLEQEFLGFPRKMRLWIQQAPSQDIPRLQMSQDILGLPHLAKILKEIKSYIIKIFWKRNLINTFNILCTGKKKTFPNYKTKQKLYFINCNLKLVDCSINCHFQYYCYTKNHNTVLNEYVYFWPGSSPLCAIPNSFWQLMIFILVIT